MKFRNSETQKFKASEVLDFIIPINYGYFC